MMKDGSDEVITTVVPTCSIEVAGCNVDLHTDHDLSVCEQFVRANVALLLAANLRCKEQMRKWLCPLGNGPWR